MRAGRAALALVVLAVVGCGSAPERSFEARVQTTHVDGTKIAWCG